MDARPADTDQETYQVWLQVLRSLSPGQRLENALRLSEQNRELALRRWRWGDETYREIYPQGELLSP